VKKTNYPQRCFNGQNHWKLGWYSDRTREVDPYYPQRYKIAAFVDYDKVQQNEYVIIRIKNLNMYLQFNRAKSFNQVRDLRADNYFC